MFVSNHEKSRRRHWSSPACALLQICGMWKNLAKPLMRQLQAEQIHISMSTSVSRREEVEGKIIKHRALFAGTHGILCEIYFLGVK